MKRRTQWLVGLLVAGAVAVGVLAPVLAQGSGNDAYDLRRLLLENRVAEVIANLGLTDAQKEQLKQVATNYRSAQSAARSELADLLAQRRDALLSGDREALNAVNEALRALATSNPLASDETAAEFVAGLTERQKLVLSQIFPGLGRLEQRVYVREMPKFPDSRPMGPHGRMERHAGPAPAVVYVTPGASLEVVDVLIDLLDR